MVLAGAWAYSTSFAGVFVLDDVRAIVRNPTIRTLSPLRVPLSPPTGATVSGRPVANLSLAINYALAPADVREVFAPLGPGAPPGAADRFLRNVRGYHLLNLGIHLTAALVLFGVVRRTLTSAPLRPRFEAAAPYVALIVSLVWVVHPLQTSAVTYVVQRVESLMGLFYLLTLYCSIRAAEGPRSRLWMVGAVVSCAFGMATKEVMVTAPIVVALWYVIFAGSGGPRRRWPLLASLAVTWGILGALVLHEYRAPSVELAGATVWRYLLTQADVVTHYLRLSVVPSPLVFLYTWPLAASLGEVALQAVLLTAVLMLTAFGIARRHPMGFVGAWFFLVLAPTSSVLPIVTEVAAEQRMYLPLAAVICCVVTGAFVTGCALLERAGPGAPARRRVVAAAGGLLTLALVAVLGHETRARNRDYWSEEGLWQDTVAKQPANHRARVAYGSVLSTLGRLTDAQAQLEAAIELNPGDPIALTRLGTVLAAQGQLDAAAPHFERALALWPDDLDAHRALGQIYAIRGQDAMAVRHLGRAAEAIGDDPVLLGRLAALLAESSDFSVRDTARAVRLAEQAVRLTSRRDPVALNVLAAAQAALGRFADAATTANEALALARAQGNQPLVSDLESRAAAYQARLRFGRSP